MDIQDPESEVNISTPRIPELQHFTEDPLRWIVNFYWAKARAGTWRENTYLIFDLTGKFVKKDVCLPGCQLERKPG